MVLSPTNPAQQLTFFFSISADGRESPLPFWGPSQSFGFSLLLVSGDPSEVTKYKHLVSPVTIFFLNGHSLMACYCSFKREDSSHPTSIVLVGYHVTECTWTTSNCQKSKRILNQNTGCENIQSRYRNEIWHRKMCHANNLKLETTHD